MRKNRICIVTDILLISMLSAGDPGTSGLKPTNIYAYNLPN